MNETKRLTGYSYKLMGLGNIPGLPAQEQANQFGLDVPFGPDDLEIDENQMSCVIPFADGNRVDGSGDVIEVAGIKTERHRANPIVLFDHGKQVTLPVALSEDPITKLYTVEIDPIAKKAKGRAFFYQGKWGGKNFNGATEYDHALFCEQLFDLLAKRYIRAGSIGYQVMKGMPMQGTYGMGIPQGVHLQEVNMLEYSAVVLPCNQDTVGKALSLRRVCGKPLSSHLVKSLSPYAPPRKAQMGYEGEKSANIQQMQNARQQMRQETPPQRKQQAEEAQKTNKGQKALTPEERNTQNIDREQAIRDLIAFLSEESSKAGGGAAKYDAPYLTQTAKEPIEKIRKLSKALTPEQRQEMIDGSRLNSDEENIQAAEILRQIAGSPVRGDNPVDVVDEIVKPLEEESDKQADRKQHTKSLSVLLKSLRAKYQVKANRVFSDQDGQRKPGHGEVPEVSFPTEMMDRESDLREQQYQQAYDPRQSNLDAYEAQQRFESSQPEFDRRMDQMEMQAGVLTTSRQHPERIYGQNNFDKARLEGNMGDLPTAQGESIFSIGSNVDLKAMTPRQIADLRGVLGDMSPQMLRMLQAEQSDRLAGIDDEDDSNPTAADILPSVVEEQEKYGSDQKGFSQEWRTGRKGYSSDDLNAWEDEELQEEDELIMDNGGSRILPAATGYQNQQLPITDPDQTKKEEDWEDVNRMIDIRDQWESDNWGNDVGYPPDDSEEDPDIDYKILPEALTFLKYLASEDSSLDESGRMKCYHYAKSLEQYRGKMAIPENYEELGHVGRRVVSLRNDPVWRTHMGEDPNALTEVDVGGYLVPRSSYASRDLAYMQYLGMPPDEIGAAPISRLKYRDEASLPEQEQEQ